MSNYLLLTGATGLLGRYLLRDLLLAGRRVAVIVRPSKREAIGQRIEAILQMWETELGQELPRPICLQGDLCEERLGLDETSLCWIAENCDEIIHSAAALVFHDDGAGEPWNTNIGGTKNMLQMCAETGIKKMHYVSTAYVCGLREERIYETDLDYGQKFRNDYESSKLDAEKLVREADIFEQLTVYRPAVISGDSVTGYTNTYHGLYLYLRLIASLVPQQEVDENGMRHTPIRIPMTGDEQRNIVPVDWVSAVMSHLILSPEAHGRTFHISPITGLTPKHLINAGYEYYNSTGVEYVGDAEIDPATYNKFEETFMPSMKMYNNYELTDPTFDRTNLEKYAPDFPCPKIDRPMLKKYMQYAEEDRWGKRREKKPVVNFAVNDYINHVAGSLTKANVTMLNEQDKVVGLDVVGPGGGQWSFVINHGKAIGLIQGLSAACIGIVRLTSSELEKLTQQDSQTVTKAISKKLITENSSVTFATTVSKALFPSQEILRTQIEDFAT